jgi:protein-S-isoprenylcysteine O-methyltransferase Ste14
MVKLRTVVYVLWAPIVLFLSSGRIDWTMGWIYSGLYAGSLLVGVAMIERKTPDLMRERATYHKDTKSWDKMLAPIIAFVAPASIWLVAGLDNRFQWSPAFTFNTHTAALAVMLISIGLTLWAMASNRFFSSVVRIQHDRGHVVTKGGPYRYVRHPGYVGFIVYYLATPFILGSWWALIPAGVGIGITMVRTWLEDRTLLNELDGYNVYAETVRYRLVPGLW